MLRRAQLPVRAPVRKGEASQVSNTPRAFQAGLSKSRVGRVTVWAKAASGKASAATGRGC